MAHNYSPSAVYHNSYPVPDDGDPAIAASVNSPIQDLADGLATVAEPVAYGGTIQLGGPLEFANGLVQFSAGLEVTGGLLAVSVDATFGEDVILGSSAADTISVLGTLGVNGNATFGLNGGNQLNVISSATFSNNVTLTGAVTSSGTLTTSGTLTVDGTATFTGNVQIGDASTDSLEVYSTTLFRSQVTIGNDAGPEGFTVNAPTNFEDTVELSGTVTVGGDMNITGDIALSGRLVATNDCTLGNGSSDAINLLGATTITNLVGRMGFTSPGRVPLKFYAGPNSNVTIEASETNCVYVASISANRIYTFSDDAEEGDFIDIALETAGAFSLTLARENGFTIETLTEETGLRLIWTSGSWKVMRLAQ